MCECVKSNHVVSMLQTYHLGMQLQNTRRVTTKVAKQTQIGARMAGMNSEAAINDRGHGLIQQERVQREELR